MKTYYCPGSRKIRGQRMTIAARYRRWKRRRIMDDLAGVRGWSGA